jgi:hypothetical protein
MVVFVMGRKSWMPTQFRAISHALRVRWAGAEKAGRCASGGINGAWDEYLLERTMKPRL